MLISQWLRVGAIAITWAGMWLMATANASAQGPSAQGPSAQGPSAQGLGVAGNLIQRSDGVTALEVQQVIPGSLAQQLGIRRGDVVETINGMAPGDAATNQRALALGGRIPAVSLLRGGVAILLPSGNDPLIPRSPADLHPETPSGPRRPGGAFIPDRPRDPIELVPGQAGPNLQFELRPSPGFEGLSVQRIIPGGLGARLDFRFGDVITAVNGTQANTNQEFHRAYVVTSNRNIVLSLQRRGTSGTITIDRETLRKATAPSGTILKPLKLKVFLDGRGQVTVGGGESDGLGNQLGLMKRGVRLIEINGRAIRNGGDLKELDQQIEAGKIRQLVIRYARPDGNLDTISYP